MKKSLLLSFLLAWLAGIMYILMAAGVIHPGNLEGGNYTGIIYVAAACYIIGGLLILVKKRWLWLIGVIFNALVIIFFYSRYVHQPDVITSVPGLGTKIPQILLEIGLIYLIFTYKRKKPVEGETQ
jgi:hypothetical protein